MPVDVARRRRRGSRGSPGRALARRQWPQRLRQPARRVRAHHHRPAGMRAARCASRSRPARAARRRGRARGHGAGRWPARRGRARRRRAPGAQPRVLAAAAVVEPRRGDVDDPPAGRAQALEPLLLVAVRAHERSSNWPMRSTAERRTAKFAPQTISRLAVLRAEVERGDRRLLAPAAARRRRPRGAPGSARRTPPPPDGARAPSASASSQPGRRQHVVVHEGHERRARLARGRCCGPR